MLPISQLAPRTARVAQGQSTRLAGPSADDRGRPKDTSSAQRGDSPKPAASKSGAQLSDEDAESVRKLAARDTEVRAHEQAHAAAGGAYAGAPSFEFQRGPDGRNYAVGGEVPIDISAIPGDPQATIIKMQQVKRAALAPQEPSGADRSIAASADSAIVAARRELMTQSSSSAPGTKPAGEQSAAHQAGDASHERDAAGAADAMRSDRPDADFATLERLNAGVIAYSAAQGFSGVGAGLNRIA